MRRCRSLLAAGLTAATVVPAAATATATGPITPYQAMHHEIVVAGREYATSWHKDDPTATSSASEIRIACPGPATKVHTRCTGTFLLTDSAAGSATYRLTRRASTFLVGRHAREARVHALPVASPGFHTIDLAGFRQ
jgi:hypothetical protein